MITQLSKLNPDESYNIIGFMKCGTTALESWMKDKGYDVIRHEWHVVSPKGLQTHLKLYPGRTPIILMREPIARAWSHIHYFGRHNNPQYPSDVSEFLNDHRVDPTYHDMNPVSVSNYYKHIRKWLHLKPVILSMEALLRENPHMTRLNSQKYDITIEPYYNEIKQALKLEMEWTRK